MPFKKGQSGNPGGRPKVNKEVQALAREHTEEAIRRLAFWMRQKDDPSSAIKAMQILLERAHGKAVAQIEHTGKDGGPIATEQITDTEAARMLAFALTKGMKDGELEDALIAPGTDTEQ